MELIVNLLLSLIFLPLALIHFWWVGGGTFGLSSSLPTNEKGERILNPGKMASAVVGMGLLVFSSFYFLRTGIVVCSFPDWIQGYGGWIIPMIFLLRAIGEFRYVGFFKRVRHTEFGQMDGRFFSPLCFVLAVLGVVSQLM